MGDIEERKFRFLTLQKRLKEERLFVKNEKERLAALNKKVDSVSQNLFCIDWKNRQHWNNVDRLITAKAKPSDCSTTSRFIDSVKFEDSYGHLNYEDSKYGKFIHDLKNNPKLVALILNYCDTNRIQTSARQITSLIISTLYGNCTLIKDELLVVQVLKELACLQIFPCEDLVSFICGKRSTENAFACILAMFSEILFASKLYLTAAMHGAVMQVIVDDKEFLDYEISKVLCRLTPKSTLERYGQPGMSSTNNKIKDHVKILQGKLIKLCKKFLKSLFNKIYCFPNSLRWAIGQLYNGMLSKMRLPPANAKAIIGYMLMSYFICPAIINPEPYGINSDAYISEIARHNLCQIASIFRSLALVECGMKDDKLKDILEQLQQGVIITFVSEVLNGSEVNLSESNDALSGDIVKTAMLTTEHNLKTLINCLKLLRSYNIQKLVDEGLNELLEILPNTPSSWRKYTLVKNTTPQKQNTNDNVTNSINSIEPSEAQCFSNPNCSIHNDIEPCDITELREELDMCIAENEIVLVIPLGVEEEPHPGMLSEEKFLRVENEKNNSYGSETSSDDHKPRPSSLVDDTCDSPSLPVKKYSGNQSTCSTLSENKIDTNPFGDSFTPNTVLPLGKSTSNDVPVDTLLDFNFGNDDEVPPALPVKKRNSVSPGSNIPVKVGTDPFCSSKTHVDISNDLFNPISAQTNILGSNIGTLGKDDISNKNTSQNNDLDKMKRVSALSLLDGGQNLTKMVQGTLICSPETKLQDQFSPFSTSEVDDADPWGAVVGEVNSPKPVTNTFGFEGFENDFKPAVGISRRHTPPSNIRFSLVGTQPPPTYNEYRNNVIEKHKEFTLTKSQSDNTISSRGENTKRNSGNEWSIDKLSNRISSVFKSHIRGSESPSLKRDSFNDKIYHNLTHTNTELLPPNIEGKARTKSISSTGSEEYEDDRGEAILSKYRNMKDTSSNELIDVSVDNNSTASSEGVKPLEEDVVFNDEFKFDDAKKKLRNVLSKSNKTMLSSNPVDFDGFLLTTLQAKLAESINLQDRFSVAQYHETIRSIKQLPEGSCEKLVDHLEKEYKERAKYISYLIQSRQGVLSTISHLEETTAKLQRDRTICSKYFTTASVRSYLQHPARKREISTFAQNFVLNKMADEKCALLDEFLSNLHIQMLKDQIWMYCNEEELQQLLVATERAIVSIIYKDAFYPNSIADCSNDKIFHEHIKYLSEVITLSHPALQIPKMYQKEAPWSSAQTELLMLNAYKTPADKLSCIHRSIITIMNLLSMASSHAAGADDFLPVLVYVVIEANPPNLLSTKQYVNTFYEARLNGEELYCWMQFCAAIEFIKTIRTQNT